MGLSLESLVKRNSHSSCGLKLCDSERFDLRENGCAKISFYGAKVVV